MKSTFEKSLIDACKSHINACHEQLEFNKEDPIALVQCRIQIDKLLFQCLKNYANQNIEMRSLINWVDDYHKKNFEDSVQAVQKKSEIQKDNLH